MREGKGAQHPHYSTCCPLITCNPYRTLQYLHYPQHAGVDVCVRVQDRAIARLSTEKEFKELKAQHDERVKTYEERAREINEKCVIGDNRIKELQERVRPGSHGGMRVQMPRFRPAASVGVVCLTPIPEMAVGQTFCPSISTPRTEVP